MRSRIFKVFALLFFVYLLLGHVYVYWTGDFRESNILKAGPKTELSQPDIDLTPVLSQTFDYLSAGNQTYAFVSEDGKYVLKLFKNHTIKRSPVSHILPPVFPWRSFMLRSHREELQKRERIFVGYRLAYEKDRENTGLIFLSFGEASDQFPDVRIIDRLGIVRDIDLNRVPFVIQKKAKTTRQVFQELIDHNDKNGLQEKINQLFALYISGYEKGIVDNDHNFLDNTGFVDGRAIRLDVGKLVYDEKFKNPEVYKKDLEKIKKRLRKRFKDAYTPE